MTSSSWQMATTRMSGTLCEHDQTRIIRRRRIGAPEGGEASGAGGACGSLVRPVRRRRNRLWRLRCPRDHADPDGRPAAAARWSPGPGAGPAGSEATAREALVAISNRGGHAGLIVSGLPSTTLPQDVIAQADLVLIDLTTASGDDPRQVAFALKTQSTAVRAAARAGVQIRDPGGRSSRRTALLAQDLAPYLDFVSWLDGAAGRPRPHPRCGERYATAPASLREALAATATPGVQRWLWRMPPDDTAAAPLMAAVVQAASALPSGLVPSDRVRVACAGTAAPAYLNPGTLEIVALATCASEEASSVTPPAPGVQRVRLATGDFIVRVPARTGEDQFAEGVEVIGARSLTVAEIVARHQAAAARQAAAVRNLISRGTLTLSFEAPGFPAPVSITV